MFYTAHIVAKLNSENDPRVRHVVKVATTAVRHAGARLVDEYEIMSNTLIIAIGGDGTMLQAMRMAAQYDATAFGVNMGKVGFLTDLALTQNDNMFVRIRDIITGNEPTFIDHRIVLWSSVSDMYAGNEVSVSRTQSDAMIEYDLAVGKATAGRHKANSILISTATGSTAYSLSAGGSLIMPSLQVLQIVPVAPLTLTSRPIITDARDVISLKVWGGTIAVRHDGQTVLHTRKKWTEKSPFEIQVRPHITTAKVIHHATWNFFDILTEKLGWNK